MKTILSIIKNELKQRLFSWVTLIFFVMLVFQMIWYTEGSFKYFTNEGVLMNASSIFYRNYAGMGMLMIIIIAIATGSVLYKEIQYKSAQWTYALPISDKQFFIGRFLTAFLYLVILSTAMIVGNLLLPYSGIGGANRFGPVQWGPLFHGWIMFTIPNLFFYVSIVFFSIVFTRRIATSYLAVFLVVIIFLIAQTSYETGGGDNLIAYILADSGGYVSAQHYTELLTPIQKNTAYFKLSGYVLQNRLLWLGIALLLAMVSYFKFSFKYFIQAGVDKSKKIKETKNSVFTVPSIKLPEAIKQFRISDFLKKLWSLSKLEFMNIVRPTSFKIILGIILLMVFMQNVTWNATYYIGNELPISSNMTYFRMQWGVFVNMLIMIWAGELFFKDKTVNIWQITDSLPIPMWVVQLSRLVAIIGLSFVLSISFIFISIFTQILLGGASYIDLERFVEDLLLYRWAFLNFVLWVSLVFFVASLTSQRILTHILCVGFFIFLIISYEMGLIEDLRVGYGFTPGVEDYSEVSGYGIFQQSANWFFSLWLALAITLVMAGIWLWKRGSEKKWSNRLSFKNIQLGTISKFAMVVFFGLFLFLMSFINKNVYDIGNFTPEAEEERLDAEYEKAYKYLETKSQPKYETIDLALDFFPSKRRANFSADITLNNEKGVDTLFFNTKDFAQMTTIKLNGQELKVVKKNEAQNLTAYLVPHEIQKDSLLQLTLQGNKQYIGLVQSDFQADITYKGSFGSIQDFLPVIGYDSDKELQENRKRQEQGLHRLDSRMANIDDSFALTQNVFSTDANLVKGNLTISTESGQIPFTAGVLQKTETVDGRTVAHYTIDSPQVFNWHLGSSDYNVAKDSANKVAYSILHKPSHMFNVALYKEAITKGVYFMETHFGQKAVNNKLQLVEIHRWQDAKYTFANTIALSEKEGWVANTEGLQEKAYIYQTIGSGLTSLWVQKNVSIANVQGADMLVLALPEAMGLQFVKENLGKKAAELLIEKKTDKYAKDKNNEPNTEPTLLFSDGTDYLEENKGAIKLYELIGIIGKATFMETLKSSVKSDKPLIFKNLYFNLLRQVPRAKQKEVKEWFETVKPI
ncbi:ABC transporter permease [Flavivirga jejuensis]|uniref:ABC transporter permease n=1 Tax=Flavivirga jejuensis TaxID=870487 RepID=A0ABT8WTY4_9FLAO|nr:ABC transporter permease [Flavivirga jejuensis]MDO5976346.1 ABC transporter permease [Flavivirga jejuensis]